MNVSRLIILFIKKIHHCCLFYWQIGLDIVPETRQNFAPAIKNFIDEDDRNIKYQQDDHNFVPHIRDDVETNTETKLLFKRRKVFSKPPKTILFRPLYRTKIEDDGEIVSYIGTKIKTVERRHKIFGTKPSPTCIQVYMCAVNSENNLNH